MLTINRALTGLDLTANRLEDQGIGYLSDGIASKSNSVLKL